MPSSCISQPRLRTTTRMVLLEWWRRCLTKRRCKWPSPCAGLGLRTFQTWPRIFRTVAGTSPFRRFDRWSRCLQSFWQFRHTDRIRPVHHPLAGLTVTVRHPQSRCHDHQRRSGTATDAIAAANATRPRHLQLKGTTGTTTQTAIHRVIWHMTADPANTEGRGQQRGRTHFHHAGGSLTTGLRGSLRPHHQAIREIGHHLETPTVRAAPRRHLRS